MTRRQLEDLDALLARAREAGIHGGLLRVCLALHTGPAGQRAVADLVHQEGGIHARLTGKLDRLEALGLAVRYECPQDRRAKMVRLTAGGRAACVRVFGELLESP